MNFPELIQRAQLNASAELLAEDWQAVADALNSPRYNCKDSTFRTTNWVTRTFPAPHNDPAKAALGLTEADQILEAMQAATVPRVKAGYDSMTGPGIDLSLPETQTLIHQWGVYGAGWPQDLADRIAAYGVWQESDADQINAGADIAAEQVQLAAAFVARRDELAALRTAIEAVLDAATSDGRTIAEIKTDIIGACS